MSRPVGRVWCRGVSGLGKRASDVVRPAAEIAALLIGSGQFARRCAPNVPPAASRLATMTGLPGVPPSQAIFRRNAQTPRNPRPSARPGRGAASLDSVCIPYSRALHSHDTERASGNDWYKSAIARCNLGLPCSDYRRVQARPVFGRVLTSKIQHRPRARPMARQLDAI